MRDSLVCSLALPATAASLSELRRTASGFVLRNGTPRHIHDDVLLALDEAVTNAIRHSSRGARVVVHLTCDGRGVATTVRDDGQGFDFDAVRKTWPPESSRDAGRGLYLIANVMDTLSVFSGGGTLIRMWRSLDHKGDRRRVAHIVQLQAEG